MAANQEHEWVRGETPLVGAVILYCKQCKHCKVQVTVPEEEWEALPSA